MEQRQLEELLQHLLSYETENEWIEYKVNNIDKEMIGERISALSNSACIDKKPFGYLVFGVEDKTHKILGTTFKPKSKKVGNEELENWLSKMTKPNLNFRFYELKYKEKDIVIIEIPAAIDRPVAYNHVEYIRVGSITRKLRDFPDKEKLIWKNQEHNRFEKQIAKQSLKSDEVLKLLDYPKYFELTDVSLPSNKEGILDKLEQEKFILKEKSKYNITNLGAILFAKDLQDFDGLKRKTVRVIVYKGKNKLETIKEQEGGMGYAVGFEGLIDYINDKLPSNEEIGKALRVEKKMYPEIAIRELVANAIIHQNFSETGTGPTIEIFEDRVEISNPGVPIISTDRFIDHNPQSRNEDLASFMRRIGICEERGSGIDKVINSIEVYQLPAPKFEELDNFTKITLYKYQKLTEMDKKDKIRACYQHCCLKFVSNEQMTNTSLRERFNIDSKNYSTASRIIADTIEVNLIKLYDEENKSKKHMKYIPFWG